MAIRTAPLLHRLMLILGGLDGLVKLRTHLFMTVGTELAALLVQLKTGLGAVGIMALVAIILHRGMDMPHGKLLLPILMALKTDLALVRRCDEETLMFAGMWGMAGNTVTRPHRTMAMTLGKDCRLMTVKTETADTGAIAAQLKAHGRFVGVVTGDTALLYRGMDHGIVKFLDLGLMTDDTHLLAGAGQGHGVVGAMGIMTGDADPGARRPWTWALLPMSV